MLTKEDKQDIQQMIQGNNTVLVSTITEFMLANFPTKTEMYEQIGILAERQDRFQEDLDSLKVDLVDFKVSTEKNFRDQEEKIQLIVVEMFGIKEDVTTLKSDVSTLKSDVSVLKSDVTVLKQDVSVLKEDVSVLKEDVTVLKADVAVLKADVTVLKEDVTVLKADVTVLKEDVSVLKEDVSVLKEDVTMLKGDVTVLKADVSTLKEDVTELKVGQKRIEAHFENFTKFTVDNLRSQREDINAIRSRF